MYKSLILIVFTYLLFFKIKNNDYLSMILLTIISAYLICNVKNVETIHCKDNIETLENEDTEDIDLSDNGNLDSITFENNPDFIKKLSNKSIKDKVSSNENLKEISNDFDIVKFDNINRIGPYDGLCLTNTKKNKDKYELVDNNQLQTYLGVQGPVQSTNTDNSSLNGPTIDGEEGSPQRLFILANNKSSINCCDESNISTSTGCVCIPEKQKKFINSRGFNNQLNSDI